LTAAADLARWALTLKLEDIPERARAAACRHLLDGMGCAIAAARTDEVRAAIDVARALGGATESSIIGVGVRVSAPAAALANGALVHALDYDDTHTEALVHSTAAVLPAAFAVGEQSAARGADTLVAAIAGYEMVARLGAAIPYGFHAKGFHATSVCGVFAAALVSARLMGLSQAETVNALGIGGSMASGSLEFLHAGSSTKQLHPGLAGMNGILAARLAAAGADGPDSIFEGKYGMFASFLDVEVDPAVLAAGLGTRWEVARLTIKPYPACQLSHASLDALRALLPKLGDPSTIAEIVFVAPESAIPIVAEPAAEKQAPRTPYEGKFSLQYCAARLVLDGALGIDSFGGAMLQDVDARGLASRVRIVAKRYDVPPAEAPGIVEVTLTSGEMLHAEVTASRGGPTAPLRDDEVIAKFLSNGGSEDTARAMQTLAEQPNLRAVIS